MKTQLYQASEINVPVAFILHTSLKLCHFIAVVVSRRLLIQDMIDCESSTNVTEIMFSLQVLLLT